MQSNPRGRAATIAITRPKSGKLFIANCWDEASLLAVLEGAFVVLDAVAVARTLPGGLVVVDLAVVCVEDVVENLLGSSEAPCSITFSV